MNPITRRDMLSQTSWLGTAAAVGLPLIATGAEELPGQLSSTAKPKLKVVVTGGHPGDPEYGCGGTIALYSNLGHEVVIIYLNKGEGNDKTANDANPVRVAEAAKACEILKARPSFAGQIDGKAIVDQAHYEQFHRLIEAEQPDVVFTQWPIDNHPDHRAISLLTYESWLRMGKKFALFYYEVSNGEDTVQFAPTHYVDITTTEARKRSACYAHASQAPERFYVLQELVTRMRGIESGHKQAEGFIHLVQSPAIMLP
ncbi:MAG TPA: PIG-L family deacetylase [Verrucomicrobiae bacterium]|nr:PIG-L family deacetylase [Verrucomicrobiae bacterium]